MMRRNLLLRWFVVAASMGAGAFACTSGTTPDCSDGACGVLPEDAPADASEDAVPDVQTAPDAPADAPATTTSHEAGGSHPDAEAGSSAESGGAEAGTPDASHDAPG